MPDAEHNLPILQTGDREETTVGNYFVANYPPFSFWRKEDVSAVDEVLERCEELEIEMRLELGR